MHANLTAPTPAGKVGAAAPLAKEHRRWLNGSRDPVARYVSDQLLRPLRASTIEHLMRRVNHQCAAIIDGFAALGENGRLTTFLQPIDAAIARVRHAAFSVELVRRDAEADAAEDIAQNVLLVAPSREHAQSFLRRSREARAAAIELEIAVARKWELA